MNRNLLRPISREELDVYERDGVVWLKGIVDAEWIKLLAGTIDEIIARQVGQLVDFTGLGLALGGEQLAASGKWSQAERDWATPNQLSGKVLLDEQVRPAGERGHYISVTDAWKVMPAMRELALRSPVPRVAAALMRSNRVYLYGEQVLVKPPGTMEKTAWHSDQGYDHIQGDPTWDIPVECAAQSEGRPYRDCLQASERAAVSC